MLRNKTACNYYTLLYTQLSIFRCRLWRHRPIKHGKGGPCSRMETVIVAIRQKNIRFVAFVTLIRYEVATVEW